MVSRETSSSRVNANQVGSSSGADRCQQINIAASFHGREAAAAAAAADAVVRTMSSSNVRPCGSGG